MKTALTTVTLLFLAGSPYAMAELTTKEKVQNEIDDVKTETRTSVRKYKKELRDATGNEDRIQDAKDAVLNAKDHAINEAKKAKRALD